MGSDNGTQRPIIDDKIIVGLTDYFCPFCNQKLFRGKVAEFNIVCINCNKLVKGKQDNCKGEQNRPDPNPN